MFLQYLFSMSAKAKIALFLVAQKIRAQLKQHKITNDFTTVIFDCNYLNAKVKTEILFKDRENFSLIKELSEFAEAESLYLGYLKDKVKDLRAIDLLRVEIDFENSIFKITCFYRNEEGEKKMYRNG